MWVTYVHVSSKYKVSMSNHVPVGCGQTTQTMTPMRMMHNGQSMIV